MFEYVFCFICLIVRVSVGLCKCVCVSVTTSNKEHMLLGVYMKVCACGGGLVNWRNTTSICHLTNRFRVRVARTKFSAVIYLGIPSCKMVNYFRLGIAKITGCA